MGVEKLRLVGVLFIGLTIFALTGTRNSFLFALGILMGLTFIRGKLGFASGWRRLILYGDFGNFSRQVVLIGLASIVFIPLLTYFSTLSKALAPIAWSGAFGAFLFGIGMQIADGCGSGVINKAGRGNQRSQLVIVFFIIGNFLGTLNLHQWLSLGAIPPVDLSSKLGWLGGLLVQLVILTVVFFVAKKWSGTKSSAINQHKHQRDFLVPGLLALILIALLILFLSGQMWGIVYSFGLWGAKSAMLFGMELSIFPYWAQETTKNSLMESVLFDVTTLTNLGLFLGAWLASSSSKQQDKKDEQQETMAIKLIVPVCGGLLLGYGSRLGFGCNIGAFFSGTASGSLHSWVWFLFAFLGTSIGVKVRSRLGFDD